MSAAPSPSNAAFDTPRRRVLCVALRYTHSFGTFDHALEMVGVKAFMPSQGILTVAAYLPAAWEVRFVDENVSEVSDADLRWAEVVMTTGMHVQRPRIEALVRRARAAGALTVLGGPSVSGQPAWYPEPDIIHIGELGDATDRLIVRLQESVARPAAQERYVTEERLDLADFPLPAYHALNLGDFLIASIQWSSGCPYQCEFCDIPELYGRRPRVKPAARVLAELDAIVEAGGPRVVYFVDDNFAGNPKATTELVRELVRWQERRGFPVSFCCEATLNAAKRPELLELMRQANFRTVFCGIETPDPEALRAMRKTQNAALPILEAVRTLNSYGLEVVSGIIVGLDSDTPESGEAILRFIEASQIPMLTLNVLYALPRTPLWRRLEEAGRLVEAPGRISNVEFLLPYETVVGGWRTLVRRAYEPAALYRRFRHQMVATYPHRRALPSSRAVVLRNLRRGLPAILRMLWRVGVRSPYRREFWRTARFAAQHNQIEGLINAAMVSHHLIAFAQEALREGGEVAFYSPSQSRTPAARAA